MVTTWCAGEIPGVDSYELGVEGLFMDKVKVAATGAGSRSFGPSRRDILLSEKLAEANLEVVLMDIVAQVLPEMEWYAEYVKRQLEGDQKRG